MEYVQLDADGNIVKRKSGRGEVEGHMPMEKALALGKPYWLPVRRESIAYYDQVLYHPPTAREPEVIEGVYVYGWNDPVLKTDQEQLADKEKGFEGQLRGVHKHGKDLNYAMLMKLHEMNNRILELEGKPAEPFARFKKLMKDFLNVTKS